MPCSTSRVWRNVWLLLVMGCSSGPEAAARLQPGPAGAGAAESAAGRGSVAQANRSDDSGPAGGAGGVAGAKVSSGSGGSPIVAGRSVAAASGGAGGSSGSAARGGMSAPASAGHSGAAGKLYTDDFEDGNLTTPSWIDAEPELGGKWLVVAADGGKVLAQTVAVSDWVIAAGGDYRWLDQVVEARVKITSEPGKAGIFARVRDARNYYFLYIDGGSNLVLRKRIDNSSSDVQKTKVETVANTWYTLKLSVIGNALQGSLDGKMLVSGTDGAVSGGGIGVGTADCTAEFDDISVNGS